ncbi:hypothetical protein D3C71_970380 [compost metagenome]
MWCDVGQHRWLVEQAAEGVRLPAHQPLRAMLQGIGDTFGRDIEGGLMHQRANVDLLLAVADHGRADLQLTHGNGKALEKFRINRTLDHDPVGRTAILARGLEFGRHRDFHRQLQISIGANNERRVAAQFQCNLFHVLGRCLQHQLTDTGRAGETHRAHAVVLHQGLHGHLRFAQYHVEHAGRETRFLGELREGECRVRRFMGGLDHHGATGGQGGGGFAGDHRRREIPRGQQRADSDRLLDRAQMRTGNVAGNVLPIEAPGLFGEPRNETGGVGNFATGLGQGLALLQAENPREVFLMLENQCCPAPQNRPTRLKAMFAPIGERAVRGIDGSDDLRLIEHWHMTDQFLIRGVMHRDAVPAVAVHPMAIDIAKGLEQQWMFVSHGVHSNPCAWNHARAAKPWGFGVWRGCGRWFFLIGRGQSWIFAVEAKPLWELAC